MVSPLNYINDLFGVADKSVLVTGGSRGIGFEIAAGFVRAGARVYISSRDVEACTKAAAQLSASGRCTALPGNIASQEGRSRLAEQLKQHESKLHVLINNAGSLWAAPFAQYPESGWDKVFDVNVKGAFFLTQQLVSMLEAAATREDPARIINVGSINAMRIPTHETYAYVSSKAALHQLTRHLAGQLASRFITANVIAPGLFPSKMLQKDIERKGLDQLTGPIPLKRLSEGTDLAAAAIYLSSKASSYLTGVIIPVDGGLATTV